MSTQSSFSVSAPGSLMLMGEHAVLHHRPALCMAMNPRIHITVTPRTDRTLHLTSSFGSLQSSLDDLPESPPLRFVLAAIRKEKPRQGFEAVIHSELDATQGWGTSAAVTVAMTAALQQLNQRPFDPAAIVTHAVEVIRTVQGRGSGCDVAASTYGGIVRVEADPFRVEPLQADAEFCLAYSGYKTPTPEVIALVDTLREQDPELYESLFSAMAICVDHGVDAIRNGDWDRFGYLMDRHHSLQAALGTSDHRLEELVHGLRNAPGILGAKISGSGCGDSVLALGSCAATPEELQAAPVVLSHSGVQIDE